MAYFSQGLHSPGRVYGVVKVGVLALAIQEELLSCSTVGMGGVVMCCLPHSFDHGSTHPFRDGGGEGWGTPALEVQPMMSPKVISGDQGASDSIADENAQCFFFLRLFDVGKKMRLARARGT